MKQSRSFTEHANALADWDRSILRNRQVLLDVEEHLCQVRESILTTLLLSLSSGHPLLPEVHEHYFMCCWWLHLAEPCACKLAHYAGPAHQQGNGK